MSKWRQVVIENEDGSLVSASDPLPVSATSLPLPTGAATETTLALQAALTDTQPVVTEENGFLSVDNSTAEVLAIGAVFTGDWEDTLNYNVISIGIISDQDSAVDGLSVEWSADGIAKVQDDVANILANKGKTFTYSPPNQYFRIIYTNGGTQATINIQSIFKKAGFKASSHRISDSIIGDDDAELVKSVLSGITPSGIFENVNVSEDGNLTISDNTAGLAIAKGDVTGSTFIHKFGTAPDFDIVDGFVTVWDAAENGAAWELMSVEYSTSADIDSISSSSGSDTGLVEIQGLDSNWELVVQNATLNGQTRVVLSTSMVRVFRVKNIGTVDFSGHVIVYVNTALSVGVPIDNSKIRALVHGDNNQTEMAIFTIPAGKTGYLRDWYASTAGGKKDSAHEIKLFARPFGQVFQLKHTANIAIDGTSYIQHQYIEPEVLEAKTDIELRMNTDQDDTGVAGGFDIVLVDD